VSALTLPERALRAAGAGAVVKPLTEITAARRPLFLGIGGGGDVAGAFVASHALGVTDAVIGGVSWERRIYDPLAGPRAICELENARPLARCAALVNSETVAPSGVVLSEARMSRFLDRPVVVIDPGEGTRMAAEGIGAAASHMGCDAVVLVDVGGDVLATGQEAGLVSPLTDAVMLATTAWLRDLHIAVTVLGIGCDGELSPKESEARLSEIARKHELNVTSIAHSDLPLLKSVADIVGSGTTTLALRCASGERGRLPLRDGQIAELTESGAKIHICSVQGAMCSAPLAQAVIGATSIEDADDQLRKNGVVTTGLGYAGVVWEPPRARQDARAVWSREP
jgi:hypothetical protein